MEKRRRSIDCRRSTRQRRPPESIQKTNQPTKPIQPIQSNLTTTVHLRRVWLAGGRLRGARARAVPPLSAALSARSAACGAAARGCLAPTLAVDWPPSAPPRASPQILGDSSLSLARAAVRPARRRPIDGGRRPSPPRPARDSTRQTEPHLWKVGIHCTIESIIHYIDIWIPKMVRGWNARADARARARGTPPV